MCAYACVSVSPAMREVVCDTTGLNPELPHFLLSVQGTS